MMISRRSAISLVVTVLATAANPMRAFASAVATDNTEPGSMPSDLVSLLKLERFKCAGADALAEWARLKDEGHGWPIIVGSDDDLSRLVETIDDFVPSQSAEQILAKAATLHFPLELKEADEKFRAGILAELKHDLAQPDEKLPKRYGFNDDGDPFELSPEMARRQIQADVDSGLQLPIGDWPTELKPQRIPPAIYDRLELRDSVNILLVPVADGAEVFAYLRWVGVNDCPASEVHVAALRLWHDRYGAELVALTDDSITLRAVRRPQSREAALDLVQEQFLYCPSEAQTLAPSAYQLMNSDWWFFWWD